MTLIIDDQTFYVTLMFLTFKLLKTILLDRISIENFFTHLAFFIYSVIYLNRTQTLGMIDLRLVR